jgi:hypothetical protein
MILASEDLEEYIDIDVNSLIEAKTKELTPPPPKVVTQLVGSPSIDVVDTKAPKLIEAQLKVIKDVVKVLKLGDTKVRSSIFIYYKLEQ